MEYLHKNFKIRTWINSLLNEINGLSMVGESFYLSANVYIGTIIRWDGFLRYSSGLLYIVELLIDFKTVCISIVVIVINNILVNSVVQ